jgi:hypothetical protein
MPKFYIKSGELEVIVDGEITPFEAVTLAVQRSLGGQCLDIDGSFYVDERGFRGPNPDESVEEWSHRTGCQQEPEYLFSVDSVFGKNSYGPDDEWVNERPPFFEHL